MIAPISNFYSTLIYSTVLSAHESPKIQLIEGSLFRAFSEPELSLPPSHVDSFSSATPPDGKCDVRGKEEKPKMSASNTPSEDAGGLWTSNLWCIMSGGKSGQS